MVVVGGRSGGIPYNRIILEFALVCTGETGLVILLSFIASYVFSVSFVSFFFFNFSLLFFTFASVSVFVFHSLFCLLFF